MSRFTVNELAEHVSGRVEGDGTLAVTGTAPVEKAEEGDVTFLVGERYLSRLKRSNPTAVLIPEDMDQEPAVPARIRVSDPRHAFSRLLELFHPEKEGEPGVAPSAVIGRGVRLDPGVRIGPHVVLEEEVRVGAGTRIDALTTVGEGARIGRDCRIASGCTVCGSVRMGDRVRVGPGARLGTQGYGFTEEEREAVRMPQVGRCVIGDDVEIGANTTIDRGALGDTVVGARTKIDNLVHVGHNVHIGEDCMIVAQVGIAGSVEVGDRVQMAGQAGIAGHLKIGDGARIAAQAGVIGDVPADATYSGYPARPHRRALRASAALFRFPDLLRRMERLEDRLDEMRDGKEGAGG